MAGVGHQKLMTNILHNRRYPWLQTEMPTAYRAANGQWATGQRGNNVQTGK